MIDLFLKCEYGVINSYADDNTPHSCVEDVLNNSKELPKLFSGGKREQLHKGYSWEKAAMGIRKEMQQQFYFGFCRSDTMALQRQKFW